MSEFNTMYIISKGRPNNYTANTLIDLNYKGEWYLVCGDNDETVDDYIENYGKDKVIIFDFDDEYEKNIFNDNFKKGTVPSGATPAHNACINISNKRGEKRHWQLDDDISSFQIRNPKNRRNVKVNGRTLEKYTSLVSEFAYKTNLGNVGFVPTAHSFPENMLRKLPLVYNMHNLSSEYDKCFWWRGRLFEDYTLSIDTYFRKQLQFAFQFINFNMPKTETLEGGNTEYFQKVGLERKASYGVLIAPNAVRLSYDYGRYHHHVKWNRLKPMLLHEKWQRKKEE